MVYREFGGPGVTVRTLGQQTAQAQPLESYFSDIPNADAPTPKPGQKPLVDYFKDIGVPETGPVDPNQVVKPPTMKDADIFKPEEGADYETGAPMSHRWNMARASSHTEPNQKSEQEMYLENTFGKGNYKRDNSGTWLVKPNWETRNDRGYPEGKPTAPQTRDQATAPWTAIFPKGVRGTIENVGVGLAAGALAMAGAVGGGAAGTAAGGPVGGVAGAMAGSGFGHVADEGMKALQGFYNKTPAELARDTAVEAGVNGMFQGAGPAWNASKGWIYNTTAHNLRNISGVTQETGDLTRQLMSRYGVTPPIESIAPRAKAFAYDRVQRNRTSGDPRAEARRGVIAQRIGDIIGASGMSPAERTLAEQYVYNTGVAPSAGRTGELVRDAMTARNEMSQAVQDAYVEDAHRALDNAISTYSRNITTNPGKKNAVDAAGDTARALAKDVEGERETFGREMNVVYDSFHNAAGGQPVVDASGIVEGLKDLVHATPGPVRNVLGKAETRMTPADIPDNVAPNVPTDDIQSIMDAIAKRLQGPPTGAGMGPVANDNPVMLTIQETHRLRSALMEMVRMRGDTSPMGSRRGEIYHLVGQIDSAMDKVALDAGGTVGSAMREANQRWAEGIVRFTNNDINHILRETHAGRPPDPGAVADAIYNRKSLTAVKQIYDMLTPDTQFMVQTARLHNIIRDATIPVGKFGRPTLDADAVLETLAESASADRLVFGRNNPLLKQLGELAVAFKAAGGQIELDSLPSFSGNVVPFGRSPVGVNRGVLDIVRSLKTAQAEQVAIRREVEQDTMAALRSSDPKLVDGGVRYILSSEARTLRAAQLLGTGSPEWQLLQREAKVELLRSAIVPLTSGIGRTVNARALEDALGGLTARQQAMLLPGADLADFQLLARQAKMLFPELAQDPGGSLAAAATLGNLPKANAIRRWTWSQVAGFIADSHTVAHLLAGTLRSDPYQGRRLLGYMMQYGVNTGLATTHGAAGGSQEPGSEPNFNEQMRQLEAVHKPVKKQGYGGSDF